jgi:hypothetical protein
LKLYKPIMYGKIDLMLVYEWQDVDDKIIKTSWFDLLEEKSSIEGNCPRKIETFGESPIRHHCTKSAYGLPTELGASTGQADPLTNKKGLRCIDLREGEELLRIAKRDGAARPGLLPGTSELRLTHHGGARCLHAGGRGGRGEAPQAKPVRRVDHWRHPRSP